MSSTLASVRNALQVLLVLRRRGPQRLTDIAVAVGVGVSTAHRLVATLRADGFIVQDPDTRLYELGPAASAGSSATAVQHCVTVAKPVMEGLRDRVGETVHLAVLRGTDCIFAAAVESERMVRVTSRVGQHPAAHTAAAGKVLLATLPRAEFDLLYPAEELPAPTSRSIDRRAALLVELERTSREGFARNIGESEDDMYAIAVPVHRPDGVIDASLSVSSPLSRSAVGTASTPSAAELDVLERLRAAARGIEKRRAF